MTDLERSILLGVIIGDGCLTTRNRSLKIWHSTKQREYLEYKKALLERILNKTINTRECTHKHYSGNIYYTCGFEVTHPFYRESFTWVYPNGVKTITKTLLESLTPEAIAIWFMDDGATGCRIHPERGKTTPSSVYLDIATYCSFEQAQLIQDYFKDVWGINPKIRNTGNNKHDSVKWNINFNTKEAKLLTNIIEPFVIPSMEYKLRYVTKQMIT